MRSAEWYTTSTFSATHIWHLVELTPFEFHKQIWQQKTRIPGLFCGAVNMIYVQPF